MSEYLQVSIPVENEEQREILIAELISIGVDSFEEEARILKAFVPDSLWDEKLIAAIIRRHQIEYRIEPLPTKNWNEEWEKNFEPVMIGNFCSVRASFHEPNRDTQYEIVITPKMSFGTGHHATTYLMLELMGEMDMEGKAVLDFGTGTGILSIMAEKLGAREVMAIDIDLWSIKNAEENLAMNDCRNVRLLQSDNIPADKSFKIILANINRNVILDNLPVMCKILEADGEILLSGLMEEDFGQVSEKAIKLGLRLQKKGEKSGWIALRYLPHS
jgi:ribosomal protein L11 methyltransferase